jgi:type III pantothenate kinase
MQLVVDIGNSRTKIAGYDPGMLFKITVEKAPSETLLIPYLPENRTIHCLLSAVAPPPPGLYRFLETGTHLHLLSAQTPLPFHNLYQTPETLGKDRLANVAGAQALYPNQNCLVIDVGTCIKYDLLTHDGFYQGGNIAPGIKMRMKALHTFTARLPEVPIELPDNPIGYSTQTAMQNGIVLGAAMEIIGFTQLFAQKICPLQILFTGGDAFLLHGLCQIKDAIVEADLTLSGLNSILMHNLK